ncbi:uncharacterized protein DUF1049 [Mariniflexile fucanivorans]|uniref:Uncharacterized protein DUF1049 n=1 Tax=Mariniflexile fucanivorans TaxID=264023 RepID=A0A4R1RGG2_9FLAO|nr:LapA family protein [Mariniflexile fucanivorans]TCL65036.1 uncharacterized protein DUF1049 [Mariniflexile fucanivorans]
MNFRTVLGLLFVLVIVIFSIQNVEVTDVKFFFWKLSMSRVLIILGSFGIGVLVGYLLSLRKKIIKKK